MGSYEGEQNEMGSGKPDESDVEFGCKIAPEISRAVSSILNNLGKNDLALTREWASIGGVKEPMLVRIVLTDKNGRVVLDINLGALKEAKKSGAGFEAAP